MLNDKQRLGNMILKLRLDYKLTQEELGEKIGVNRQTLSAYERGERSPNIEQLIELSKVFGVSTDYLLGIRETNEINKEEFIEHYIGLCPKAIEILHKKQTERLKIESKKQTERSSISNEKLNHLNLYFWYINYFIVREFIDTKRLGSLYSDLDNITQSFSRVESKFKSVMQSDFSSYEVVKSDLETLKKRSEEKYKEYMRTACDFGEKLLAIERMKHVKSYREIMLLSEGMLEKLEAESDEREKQIRKYRRWPADNPPYWKTQKHSSI